MDRISSAIDQISTNSVLRERRVSYIVRDVLENVGFERHIHIDCPYHPAELTLPYVEDTIDLLCFFTRYL